MKRYYIAYGSNLNIEQMKWRCPSAKLAGKAIMKGYELLFKGSKTGSYLTIEPKAGGEVPVGLWEVTAEDERSLDRYEGCPTFYYKAEVNIPFGGKLQRAFVYIMHEDRLLGLPTQTYVETCLEGYRDFGFNSYYLSEAIAKSKGGNGNERTQKH